MYLNKDGLIYFWGRVKAALSQKVDKSYVDTAIEKMAGNIVIDVVFVGAEAPGNTKLLWVDSGNSYCLKFYNESTGQWQNVAAVWS